MNNYPESIKKSVEVLCEEIKKYYPKVFEKSYNSFGIPIKDGEITFQSRMEMGIYIELAKAGDFNGQS